MSFRKLLSSDQFINIAELEPTKGIDTSDLLMHADSLKGRAHAVLTTEMSGAILRMGSMGASFLLKQKGIETIVNMNCRDRNRLALQADLLSSYALGLENLFISQGDEITSGDHIEAKPVNDLDITGLLEALKKLQKGIDMAGNDLAGIPEFCVGSEANAGQQDGALEVEIMDMEKKIKAGANFFFTSSIYDLKVLENFIKKASPFKVPVFPRITILNSVGMARFMCRHMDGVIIPDEVIDRLAKAPDKTKEGISIAADTIRQLHGFCRGALLVAVGRQERLSQVLEQV